MDDNQCRVCLGEANDGRLSVFKRVNGVAIEEKLQFVTGLKVIIFICARDLSEKNCSFR